MNESSKLITLIENLSIISIEKLINILNYLNKEEKLQVEKAYEFASLKHQNQYRKSGDPYITHPLSVAYILSYFYKADKDTIIASLLHDVVEDTKTSILDIERMFGKEVSILVDGITKFDSKKFKDKTEKVAANQRKLMTSILKDPRSSIIKVCDNLHNILTLQYHKPEKRIENAMESLEYYVPLAKRLGMNTMATMISDLALKYISTNSHYKEVQTFFSEFILNNYNHIIELKRDIQAILNTKNIEEKIEIEYKDLYSMHEQLSKSDNLNQFRDMVQLKIIVKNEEDCAKVYAILSKIYPIFHEHFRDYIKCPKAELYKSIDGPIEQNTMVQIRTKEMDKVEKDGIASYWNIYGKNAKTQMIEVLKNKSNFYAALMSMNNYYKENIDFLYAIHTIVNEESLDTILYGTIEENPFYSSMIRKIIDMYFDDNLKLVAKYSLEIKSPPVYKK